MGQCHYVSGNCHGEFCVLPQGTTDEDDDFYDSGVDCNDGDAQINPGADEVCDNGIDDDCDGLVDCDDNGCALAQECAPASCPHCPDEDWGSCPSNCLGHYDTCANGPSGCPGNLPGMQTNYCWCYRPSPIVIDVAGDGFNLTGWRNGVDFDLIGDGLAKRVSWTRANSDDAWLTLDRNGNGWIDNGTELFGTATPQSLPPQGEDKQGFLALGEFDKSQNGGNADGMISRLDSIFPSLRLWQDINHNGKSESVELKPLAQLGLAKLDLDYKTSKRVDQHGNEFRYRARVKDIHGAQIGRWAWDVFLMSPPLEPQ